LQFPAHKRIGRYEICSQLGAGGMGEVYLANDTRLDRKVALKILPADVVKLQSGASSDRIRRFVQEAKAASALNHPNILTIYEIDEVDAEHFIATEFVDGETLRDRVRTRPCKPGPEGTAPSRRSVAMESFSNWLPSCNRHKTRVYFALNNKLS
jgi:serine/threonine protein kinase